MAYTFSSKKQGVELSNFWLGEIVLGGLVFPSGEHAFHGMKYHIMSHAAKDPSRKEALDTYSKLFLSPLISPSEAKKVGNNSRLVLHEEELDAWYQQSIAVQREICFQKYQRYPEIRELLKNTGDKVIIHPSQTSDKLVGYCLWEGRAKVIDGKMEILGENMLGKLWMELRDGTAEIFAPTD
jgi:ribA/ribD-fused uncharacterized protein